MPYEVKRDPESCSESKPWAVRNTETDEVKGCHATEADAKNHMAALQANVSDAAPRTAPEQRTIDVDVQNIDTRGKTVVGYAAVYGAEARLDGFTETIRPGAFAGVLDDDVRALLNHDPNVVLGRTKSGTLRLADDRRGLRFELDLPESRSDLREAIARGDLDGASFRFRIGEDEWDGDRRTVTRIDELRDITLATYPAYPDTSIELRTRNHSVTQKEKEVTDETHNEERTEEVPPGGGFAACRGAGRGRADPVAGRDVRVAGVLREQHRLRHLGRVPRLHVVGRHRPHRPQPGSRGRTAARL